MAAGTGYGSLGSGLAQGFLGASALNQKRDAATATAKYQQGALDSQALDKQIAGTEFLIKDTQAKLENIRQAKLQTKDAAQLEKLVGLENNLLDAGATLIGQYGQMTGMDMSQLNPREMLAAGSGTPAKKEYTAVGVNQRLVDENTGTELVGPDTDAAWVVKEGADGNWYRMNPVTKQSEQIQSIEQAGDISASNAVLKVNKPDGVVETWIHSSVLPEDHGQPVNSVGYVKAAEGGPAQSILKGSLFNPNPPMGPDGKTPMSKIIAVDRASMTLAELEEYKDNGYFWVQDPGLEKEGVSGAEAAAGLAEGTPSQRFDTTEGYTKNVVEGAMTRQLIRDLHRAGEGVVGVPGYLREHIGGALGGLFAPIGLDGEAAFNDLVNWATGSELSADEVANIRTKFRQMIAPAVKVYTGEQSGRITKEEREIGFQTLAATKALRSITQARQALLGMLTLQESEQMRIRALLGQEQLVDMTNFEQFSDFASKLYNDMGGEGPGSDNHVVLMGAVTQVMDNLKIIQEAILAGVKPGGVLTDRKWAQSKAAN